MAPIGVSEDDVLDVLARPTKTAPADFGRTNAWGFAKNGIRIRVTYHHQTGEIRTVAIADERFS